MSARLLSVSVRHQQDVVLARQRARQLAALLGLEAQDQVRIATAVSEIARNAFEYGGGGRVEFTLEGRTSPQVLIATVSDQGPGIPHLEEVLDGRYRSPTGMGLGIVGARRLVDQVQIEAPPGRGTTVSLKKVLPRHARLLGPSELAALGRRLAEERPQSALDEVQQQNQELLRTLEDLRRRQAELSQLNRELEDTNRGVVALYAELDEKADHLRRADDMKSRFLSNMSHEFRTPLNSIIAISRLLEERSDGELTDEQSKQVRYIKKAADDLAELVNDLLDLAKVEAGKTVIRPAEFEASELFGALRGMLRPLLVSDTVNLVFEEPADVPRMLTDEGKLSQILRNFISNALKFTESGEIRVKAEVRGDGREVAFSVADTGMGIAPEDHERIFGEFAQVEHVRQKRVRGTGLGLPLSRRLAELLGGRVELQSALGVGSTFVVTVPVRYEPPQPAAEPAPEPALVVDALRTPVLVVDSGEEEFHLYERCFKGSGLQPVFARTVAEAQRALERVRPRAVVMDVQLAGEDAWGLLASLKASPEASLPVLVTTSVDDEPKALALGADAYHRKPIDRHWLLSTLKLLVVDGPAPTALVIDDDEIARYVLRTLLADTHLRLDEATSGEAGLERIRASRPDVVFLDLVMPGGMSGYDVLDRLKADPATATIPVIVMTSQVLERDEHLRLTGAVAIVPKQSGSRSESIARVREALFNAGLASADVPSKVLDT